MRHPDGAVLSAQPRQDRLQVSHVRPVCPCRCWQHGRGGESGRQDGELPTIHIYGVDSLELDCVVALQDGIRLVEDERQQRCSGHVDRVSEGEQLADVVEGVALPPFGEGHQGLGPPLD